jgi:8-oxo-dGTP diphosphatase
MSATATPADSRAHGKTHITTLVYAVHEHRVLMLKRNREPNRGLWSPPGGKLEPGESPLRGAMRELLEETGIRAPSARLAAVVTERDETSGEAWLMFVVRADIPSATPLVASDEGSLAWIPIESLSDLATPPADPHIAAVALGDDTGVAFLEVRFQDGSLVHVETTRAS